MAIPPSLQDPSLPTRIEPGSSAVKSNPCHWISRNSLKILSQENCPNEKKMTWSHILKRYHSICKKINSEQSTPRHNLVKLTKYVRKKIYWAPRQKYVQDLLLIIWKLMTAGRRVTKNRLAIELITVEDE